MVKTPEPELILLLFLIPLILAGHFIFRRRSRTVLFEILFILLTVISISVNAAAQDQCSISGQNVCKNRVNDGTVDTPEIRKNGDQDVCEYAKNLLRSVTNNDDLDAGIRVGDRNNACSVWSDPIDASSYIQKGAPGNPTGGCL